MKIIGIIVAALAILMAFTGMAMAAQGNVVANTEITFVATGDGGNILGSENIMIDGAGMPTSASDRMICPYGPADSNVIPAYCTIVKAGSRYDLTVGSVVTSADDRFVGTDATVPVMLNYGINVKPYTVIGQGTSPAIGSSSSYYTVSIKEGRTGYWDNESGSDAGYTTPPDWQQMNWDDVITHMAEHDFDHLTTGPQNEDITYSESSSASGIINSFSTTYAYQSGKALLP